MEEKKSVVFRSKYERHQIYNGAKKIRFVKNHYKTDDPQEIDFLRKQAAKSAAISEIKPEVKMVAVRMEEGETEEAALEKALSNKKVKKPELVDKSDNSDKAKK